MASDAYMEVSPEDIIGETGDIEFGKPQFAMFQIASIEFGHSAEDKSSGMSQLSASDAKALGLTPQQIQNWNKIAQRGGSGKSTGGIDDSTPKKGTVTITKSIDYSSPDLFKYCCKKTEIQWAIIYIREAGETKENYPWLRIEFSGKVYVKDFKWSIDPGAEKEEAMKTETVMFEFEKVLIRYWQQDPTGEHTKAEKQGYFNYVNPAGSVSPIPS